MYVEIIYGEKKEKKLLLGTRWWSRQVKKNLSFREREKKEE